MDGRLKLAQGLRKLPPSARQDLAQREQDIQRGKTVELLRRAGKEMYDNPIVNTAIGFTPGVGDVQAGVEAYRSANEGDWTNAGLNALGMLPFIPALGKTVWHGSPHTFEKFDLSKIGTGEGAQAYGHGLYLAESPATARQYQIQLAGPKMTDKEADDLIRYAEANAKRATDESVRQGYLNAAEEYRNIKLNEGQPGSLYKVDLPDEQIAKMLDWDKPLSQQPESVRNALTGIEQELPEIADFNLRTWMDADPLASTWHNAVVRDLNVEPAELSAKLQQRGIPGLQYFDSGSRGGGDGTRNYVVFSDEIPQILERNNQPLVNALRIKPVEQLESLNPTGTIMTEYNPASRATLPLGKNLTTLDVTMGANPDEMVTIYRGVPSGVSEISPGDFITTNEQLAKDYAGNGKVISQKVPARTVLDDLTEPLGEEYIYRP